MLRRLLDAWMVLTGRGRIEDPERTAELLYEAGMYESLYDLNYARGINQDPVDWWKNASPR